MSSRFSVVPGESAGTTETAGMSERDELGAWLIAGARGDESAFAKLYDATASGIYGLVLRVLRDPAQAREVTQDIYLEIWQQAARFDPSRGNVRTWMFTIAHRRAVDRVRSVSSATERDIRYGTKMAEDAPDVSDQVVDQLEAERVRRAVDTLTDVQRDAVQLAYFGGYTHTELAHMLDIPLGTAKTRLRDGLIRLRDALGGTR